MINKFSKFAAAFTVAGGMAYANDALAKCFETKASWYSIADSSNLTASGEDMSDTAHTAAHRSLPFGTRLRVTNKNNGKSIVVRINDRGPAKWTGKDIDIAKGAASQIGMIRSGVAQVEVCRL